MSILLFEHNLNALNKVKTAWLTSKRTCIVHATGTGKSLIISKNIEENPNSKHLFLAPSTFIFEEIKKHLAKEILQNVLFQSYAYFLDKEDLDKDFFNLNFIYLDEFHRVGATKWGNAVNNILEANPQAYVLGASATPIRYLDDSRNMAEELFNNNIASELPLGEAILRGIHKKPKYVTTLYNYSDILSKTRNKIQKSNLDDIKKNQELERLRSVEINWNSSKGIDTILKKYLNVERKKILVFCRDTEHRDEALKLLKPILNKIYKSKVDYFSVGSDLPEKTNFNIISTFRKDVEQASVLFSVNMLNEGLHVDGTDTCIFFRDTESPIIYFQQLGRVFHTNQLEQPLIIDLINNFKLSFGKNDFAKKAFESFGEQDFLKGTDLSLIIDLYDEIKDFSEVIDSFKIESWEVKYEELKEYFKENNKLPVQKSNSLSIWVQNQKSGFKNNKLSQERIDLLTAITPEFFEIRIIDWDIRYEELKEYFQENNKLPNQNRNSLGRWVGTQKGNFKSEKLSQEQIDLLTAVTPEFFEAQKINWESRYEELKEYFQENNKLPLQKSNLGRWVSKQKNDLKNKKLSQEQIDLLTAVTPEFFEAQKINWESRYEELKEYFQENKNLPNLNRNSLGNWISKQKSDFKNKKLSQEQIDLLTAITPEFFEIRIIDWESRYEELKEYFQENNKLPYYKESLGMWVNKQKMGFKNKKLSQEQIDLLTAITPEFFEIRIIDWESRYEELKEYFQENNKLPVQKSNLGSWVSKEKRGFKNKKLSQERINLLTAITPDFFKKGNNKTIKKGKI